MVFPSNERFRKVRDGFKLVANIMNGVERQRGDTTRWSQLSQDVGMIDTLTVGTIR